MQTLHEVTPLRSHLLHEQNKWLTRLPRSFFLSVSGFCSHTFSCVYAFHDVFVLSIHGDTAKASEYVLLLCTMIRGRPKRIKQTHVCVCATALHNIESTIKEKKNKNLKIKDLERIHESTEE